MPGREHRFGPLGRQRLQAQRTGEGVEGERDAVLLVLMTAGGEVVVGEVELVGRLAVETQRGAREQPEAAQLLAQRTRPPVLV
ncbi:hypothetical protein [Nocardioides fonticola]|uniref:hypothetical protein n=1 Tax=Nocardioides fonticola TaxID=450363 RepID=UPI0031E034CE